MKIFYSLITLVMENVVNNGKYITIPIHKDYIYKDILVDFDIRNCKYKSG